MPSLLKLSPQSVWTSCGTCLLLLCFFYYWTGKERGRQERGRKRSVTCKDSRLEWNRWRLRPCSHLAFTVTTELLKRSELWYIIKDIKQDLAGVCLLHYLVNEGLWLLCIQLSGPVLHGDYQYFYLLIPPCCPPFHSLTDAQKLRAHSIYWKPKEKPAKQRNTEGVKTQQRSVAFSTNLNKSAVI